MYRGSYSNNQGQYQGNTNNAPAPHHNHHQQQQSDGYGQQQLPPQQSSYYQPQQQQQGQQYGSQPTGTSSHGVYPHPTHHQQQVGYPQQTNLTTTASGGGGGGGGGGAGPLNNAYASYNPTLQPYPNSYPAPASKLEHQQQQQLQQGVASAAAYYNQPVPPPAAAAVPAAVAGPLPHQHQHYTHHHQQQQQQQHTYQPPPPPDHQPRQFQQQQLQQQHQSHAYADVQAYSSYHGAAAAPAVANVQHPLPPAPAPAPVQRAVEDTHQYFQHQHPGQGYDQAYGQGNGYLPPLTATVAAAAAPLAFSQQQQPLQVQLQLQQQQYSRYEPEHPSRMRHRERGGGPVGQYVSETRKAHSSAGGGGGGGGGGNFQKNENRPNGAGPQKKRSRKSGATPTTTTRSHEKNIQHTHHRSNHSPAPTDSQMRLPATAAATATAATTTEYAVHLPAYQLGATPSMDYVEVSRRFERLIMPEDFIEVVRPHQPEQIIRNQEEEVTGNASNMTTNGLGLSQVLNLNGSLPVHHEICTEKIENKDKKKGQEISSLANYDPDPRLTAPPPQLPTSMPSSFSSGELPVVYNAKVVLLSGLHDDDKHAILNTTASTIKKDLVDHISCRLKFIVARAERAGVKSGIFSLGGRCDPCIDGNPEIDGEKALIHAATRHALIQTGVDLSVCQRWFKILEVKYHRLGATETAASHFDATIINKKDNITSIATDGANKEGGYIEKSIFFLVDDGHRAVPCVEEWPAAWEKRHTQQRTLAKTSDELGGINQESKYEEGKDQEMIENENEENKEEEKNDDEKEIQSDDDCEEGELPETASPLLKTTIPSSTPAVSKVEKMPADPRLLFIGLRTPKLRLKTMSISLDGLLDYNESDIEEATFEMSLFAETMHEMLSRDAGETIYTALKQKPWKYLLDKSTYSSVGAGGGKTETQEGNKRKLGEEGKEEEEKDDDTAVPNFIAFDEANEDNKEEKPEKEENVTTTKVQEEEAEKEEKMLSMKILLEKALFAFSYFDAGGLGYILTEDLQVIIESLGLHLHHGVVKELCQAAAEASGSKKKNNGGGGGKIEYRKLCCSAGKSINM